MRRIVVTGLGAVTPLAAGVEASWSHLLAGRSGIRRLPDDVVRDLPAKVGGSVASREDPDGFDPDAVLAPKDQRKVDRFILLALAAAEEALAQAQWKPALETDRLRTATIIASGIGGFLAITDAVRTVDLRGVRRLWPFTIPSFLVNLAAGHISIRHVFQRLQNLAATIGDRGPRRQAHVGPQTNLEGPGLAGTPIRGEAPIDTLAFDAIAPRSQKLAGKARRAV